MTFPIDITIPNANNDPADDVTPMRDNFANTRGFLAVDHVAPGTTGAGWHEHVTYKDKFPPAVPPTGQITVDYTNVGIADPTVPQRFWRNALGIFPMSSIRAYGVFTTTLANTTVALDNGINVGTITSSMNGQVYTMNLTTNCVAGNNVIVLVTLSNGGTATWTFTNPTLVFNTTSTGSVKFSFVVLQI